MRQPTGPASAPLMDRPSLSTVRDHARKDALSQLLAGSREGDLLLLAGGGMDSEGQAAEEYRRKHGHPELVFYSPGSIDGAVTANKTAGDTPGLARDLNELAEKLAGHLVYRPAARISLFPPSQLADPGQVPQLRQARAALDKALARSRVNGDTQVIHWRSWLNNLTENFPHAFRKPDLTSLQGVFRGIPALVLGAGPSLDKSIGLLPEACSKCLVLGAASVLAPLETAGASPHLAVALEGKDESRQFKGADPSLTLLAASSSSHFNHFRRWPGKSSVFHMQAWASHLTGQGLTLPTGGHATSAAFSLAVLWGCDPIILAGQDLAYPGGRVHASSRPGGEDYTLPDLAPVPAIGGGLAQTSAVMESYLHWYQESASYLKKADPGRRLINATAQGAFIPGFDHQHLDKTLRIQPKLPDGLNLVRLTAGLPRASKSVMDKRLSKEIALARRTVVALKRGNMAEGSAIAGEQSAAAWVMQSLPRDEAVQSIASNMEYLLECLAGMREALHAAP